MPSEATDNSCVSFLLLPNEILEIILLEASSISSSGNSLSTDWRDTQFSIRDLHLLSTICRRFCHMLLPRIYRDVRLTHGSNKSRLQFLRLLPSYGHFCQNLTIRIVGMRGYFCASLRQYCKHLTNLRVLQLGVHLDGGERTCSDCFREIRDPTTMGTQQLTHWKNLCAALPRVTELHLHGFTWADAAVGFPNMHLSTVRTFGFHPTAPSSMPSLSIAHTFNLAFPGLVNITFPVFWCPDLDLVRVAFANRRLENITITKQMNYFSQTNACLELLLELNAASLTSLIIISDEYLGLSRKRAALLCLTSLILDNVPIGELNWS
jgi:hypothetical protein